MSTRARRCSPDAATEGGSASDRLSEPVGLVVPVDRSGDELRLVLGTVVGAEVEFTRTEGDANIRLGAAHVAPVECRENGTLQLDGAIGRCLRHVLLLPSGGVVRCSM